MFRAAASHVWAAGSNIAAVAEGTAQPGTNGVRFTQPAQLPCCSGVGCFVHFHHIASDPVSTSPTGSMPWMPASISTAAVCVADLDCMVCSACSGSAGMTPPLTIPAGLLSYVLLKLLASKSHAVSSSRHDTVGFKPYKRMQCSSRQCAHLQGCKPLSKVLKEEDQTMQSCQPVTSLLHPFH